MSYTSRQTAPKKDNKFYYSTKNPFYPNFVNQCTWYCNGRCQENGFSTKGIPTSNAENWYHDYKGNKGQTPRLGSILVWECSKLHHSADGCGHVATVERIYEDGSVLVSHSGSNMKFATTKIDKTYKYPFKSKYVYSFAGFIYPEGCSGDIPTPQPKPTPSPSKEEYYTIKKGDTLSKIAKKYKTTVKNLMALNPKIKDKNKIYAGDKIRVK